MHSGAWDPPRYERLERELLGALEGEVLEIGPGSGVNLKHYRDNLHWTGASPAPSCTKGSGSGVYPPYSMGVSRSVSMSAGRLRSAATTSPR
jgi:hypothetical protein